jgi:hypothetical protein
MKYFRLFSLLAVLLALCVAVMGATVDTRETETDLEDPLEGADIDEGATALANSENFDEPEDEAGGERERRGGNKHAQPVYPVYPPPKPAPQPCCYWKGYQYKPNMWYGNCYCDKTGNWVCVKPQPPKPNCCYWNNKVYYHQQKCSFNPGYSCYCYNGQWINCHYQKPVYKPEYKHYGFGHKKW